MDRGAGEGDASGLRSCRNPAHVPLTRHSAAEARRRQATPNRLRCARKPLSTSTTPSRSITTAWVAMAPDTGPDPPRESRSLVEAIDGRQLGNRINPSEHRGGRLHRQLRLLGAQVIGRSSRIHDDPARGPSRRCGQLGQVLQRVGEMLRAERRELDAPCPDELRHRRPVVSERDFGLGRTEWGQVVTPYPAAELQLTVALSCPVSQPMARGESSTSTLLTTW
jgi:hypothetical protein